MSRAARETPGIPGGFLHYRVRVAYLIAAGRRPAHPAKGPTMTLVLANGERKTVEGRDTVIVATRPNPSIDDPATWESDRAWLFARVGRVVWRGQTRDDPVWSEIVEIV